MKKWITIILIAIISIVIIVLLIPQNLKMSVVGADSDSYNHNTLIGTVGNTGNAINTPAHLHYAIVTIIPYPWRIDGSKQGWRKMFYLNPIDFFK